MLNTGVVFSLLFYIVLFLAACSKPVNDPIIILSVDREFSLDLWENIQPNATPLEIHLASIEDQDCLNKTIHSTYNKVGSQLFLTIAEIIEPETCIQGNAPALGSEVIHNIDEGIYDLTIELQDVVTNTGKLSVTEEAYTIQMDYETGIKWKHKTLLKVPENALWGYLSYEDVNHAPLAFDWISSLKDRGATFDRANGYFGYFTMENHQIIAVNNSPIDLINIQLFIQYYDGSLEELSTIVDNFHTNAPQGMELRLFDDKGNEW